MRVRVIQYEDCVSGEGRRITSTWSPVMFSVSARELTVVRLDKIRGMLYANRMRVPPRRPGAFF
jgi:hypothetical protein